MFDLVFYFVAVSVASYTRPTTILLLSKLLNATTLNLFKAFGIATLGKGFQYYSTTSVNLIDKNTHQEWLSPQIASIRGCQRTPDSHPALGWS